MLCPYCGEGPIYSAFVPAGGEYIRICAECDTVWRKTDGIIEITNYSSYSETLGQAPLWDNLRQLSVLESGEELP